MSKQVIASIIVLVALAAGTIGYVIGASGATALRAKLDEVKKMFPVSESSLISGQVKSVNGNVIILNTPTSNPFDESPEVRQIVVTAATRIVKNENKSPETVRQEQEAFQKKVASFKPDSTSTLPVLPTPFIEKDISISDIREGDQISVEAEANVYMMEKFEAAKITVGIEPAVPASAPVTTPPASSKP